MFMLRLRVWLGMPWWPWRPWRPWLHTPFAFACTMAYCAGWGTLLLSKQMFRRGRFSGEVNYGCHSRVRSLVRLAISQNHPVAYHRLFPAISPRLLFIYTPAYIPYTETVFREPNTHTHTHIYVFVPSIIFPDEWPPRKISYRGRSHPYIDVASYDRKSIPICT